MNVNNKIPGSICCGCSVCADSCPVNAIEMGFDSEWRLYPVINNKCINCGKCLSVCPQYTDKPSNDEAIGYAVAAPEEVRMESSSGGVFYILAEYVIHNGGYVAGAVFDDEWQVKHILTDKMSDVKRMQHSKYVQSRAEGIYNRVVEVLRKDKYVLFSGTPCQVAALRNFTKDKYQNLITFDILCHGVPSPKLFEYYLNENFDKSEIADIIFRNKRHRNATVGSITFVLKSGKEVYSEYFDNAYMDAFLDRISERSSCLNCKYAIFPRVGDISAGDFWGAKTTDTQIDKDKGISVLFLNSEKGRNIWKKLKGKFYQVESYDNDTLMSWNRNKIELKHNARCNELIPSVKKYNSLRAAVSYIKNNRYDVGLFGIVPNPNYGGLITYYALYKYVCSLGYSVLLIHKPEYNSGVYKNTFSREFFKSHCILSEVYKPSELQKLNSLVDTFLLGSDQVWNYSLFNCWHENLYFDFVDSKKKKIAYAASFGLDTHTVSSDRKGVVSSCLKDFDYIGVREEEGTKILERDYNLSADVVADPVFLVDTAIYTDLAKDSTIDCSGQYIGTYIIEPNAFKLEVINRLGAYLKIKSINVTDGNMDYFQSKSRWFTDRGMYIVDKPLIENWLNVIINADFVVTDSYHCCCFCIMFNKPFIVLQERWALSRLATLLSAYNLNNRWLQISDIHDFSINKLWFKPLPDYINQITAERRKFGQNWLKNALLSSKTVCEENNRIPVNDKERVEDYFYFLMQNRNDYIIMLSSTAPNKDIIERIDFKSKLTYIKHSIDAKAAFLMVYDCGEDKLFIKNDPTIEFVYKLHDRKLICLVNTAEKKLNKIYVYTGNQCVSNTLGGREEQVISIYSKRDGKVIDSFNVGVVNGVAVVKRG